MSREDIIVVIQCAAGKNLSAGRMMTENKQPVIFIADPRKAPPDRSVIYSRPDDPAHLGLSWRDVLVEYNKKYKDSASDNPLGLLPAWKLYKNFAYGELISAFGIENVFILSAGWGLIPAGFLTPYYDITFSRQAEEYKRRHRSDCYEDLAMLPEDTAKPVVFLGGKDYVPLFCSLTKIVRSRRTVFYNSQAAPHAPGCGLFHFPTKARTNWHYRCAKELALGNIDIGRP